ncbi:MAG: GHMP kinase [Sporomusaceae bacterium]|jgi:L-threonine kinase|nr:GHMP kinase [Sporomusaceae bacterium]
MPIKIKAPGACGELAQGTIDGVNFLITCPIDWYSEACVLSSAANIKPKTAAAIRATLKYLGVSQTINVKINSTLPQGKGMASSSADISAACQAVALLAAQKLLSPDEIAGIALSIEPTDAIFYPGIMMFDHLKGKIRRPLGNPPPMPIAVFDIAGCAVDTINFNARQDLAALNRAKEKKTALAAEMIIEGIAKQNPAYIGQGATLSALANQDILFKPHLEKIIAIAAEHAAHGVCIAHSGTVFGVLLDAEKLDAQAELSKNICRLEENIKYLKTVNLIAGGLSQGD